MQKVAVQALSRWLLASSPRIARLSVDELALRHNHSLRPSAGMQYVNVVRPSASNVDAGAVLPSP